MFWLLPHCWSSCLGYYSWGHQRAIQSQYAAVSQGAGRKEQSLGKEKLPYTKVKRLCFVITWDECGVLLKWNLAKDPMMFKLCSRTELILTKEFQGKHLNRIMKNWVIILVVTECIFLMALLSNSWHTINYRI